MEVLIQDTTDEGTGSFFEVVDWEDVLPDTEGPMDDTAGLCDKTCAEPGPCWHMDLNDDCDCVQVNAPNGAPCSDGDLCTLQDHCDGGACTAGIQALKCDDGNPCTLDYCTGSAGCRHAPLEQSMPCDDGDPCTAGEVCSGGLCTPPTSYNTCAACDEADPDACDAYNDDNVCNGVMACIGGACQLDPATVVVCEADTDCQTHTCHGGTGECVPTPIPAGVSCDDGDPCTDGTKCDGAGDCTGGETAAGCACTTSADCDSLLWNHCDGTMECQSGVCALQWEPVVCAGDDGPCHSSLCHPDEGCILVVLEGASCDDEDPCTFEGTCSNEGFCNAPAKDCTDPLGGGVPPMACAAAICDSATGACVYDEGLLAGHACDVGGPCHAGPGACEGGLCTPTAPHLCDDGLACTADLCEPAGGDKLCHYDPAHPTCSEIGACAGSVIVCDDGVPACEYGDGHALVELCGDGVDNDCDGTTDQPPCGYTDVCVNGELVALVGGEAQACEHPGDVAEDLVCGEGWRWCNYTEMLGYATTDGAPPPEGFLIAATVTWELETGAYSTILDSASPQCWEATGACTTGHTLQAVTSSDGYGDAAYAAPAWPCVSSDAGGLSFASSCSEMLFPGVLCCPNECESDDPCSDGDPCTEDQCLEGLCSFTPKSPVSCLDKGVCAGMSSSCEEGNPDAYCDYGSVAAYEPDELSCDGLDNDCDGQTDEESVAAQEGDTCDEVASGICVDLVPVCQQGQWACKPQTIPGYEPLETACDGLDSNCDGIADESFLYAGSVALGQPCVAPGGCALVGEGAVHCSDDAQSAVCSTGPGGADYVEVTEACNGVDDDCDGEVDEGVEPEEDFACNDQGVCADAYPVCDEGSWSCPYGLIDGFESGAETRCDGLDNDCDGEVDEGFILPGEFTELGGACVANGTAGHPTPCNGTVICDPASPLNPPVCDVALGAEICDNVDNDCNGFTDEGLTYDDPEYGPVGALQPCTRLGACVDSEVAAFTTCDLETGALVCAPNAEGTAEVCNGIDDDCDGVADDGFLWNGIQVQGPCSTGDDSACGNAQGVVECGPAGPTCSTLPGGSDSVAQAEHCDGLDNDCDGAIDEGLLNALAASGCFQGVCTAANTIATCENGTWECDRSGAVAAGYTETDTSCDGLDNDCDGEVDQGVPNLGAPCDAEGDDDQCAGGVFICDGVDAVSCSGDVAIYESCNGLDDDCDSEIDEGLGSSVCGEGLCEHEVQNCVNGLPQQCNPGEGSADEVCNGLDDDCDGLVDGPPTALEKGDPHPCSENGQGVCAGVLAPSVLCVDGEWSACTEEHLLAQIGPVYEVSEVSCDGLDNDCDGLTDGEDPDVLQARPLCALQEGVCLGSYPLAEACTTQGWEPCGESDYLGHTEVFEAGYERTCDGIDNDCDGEADDGLVYKGGLPMGDACAGQGLCGAGVVVCALDGESATCSTNANAPGGGEAVNEVCNGLDDDCDGSIDEGLEPEDSPCLEGVCTPDLMQPTCAGLAGWICDPSGVPDYQNPEVACDGLDNDCDGSVDEGFPYDSGTGSQEETPGQPCPDATDNCPGVLVCNTSETALTCSNQEICNGLDDDCDGNSDEEVVFLDPVSGVERVTGQACVGQGSCGGLEGTYICHGTEVLCSADLGGEAELCDGHDDDCDGHTDEGFFLGTAGLGDICHAGTLCEGIVVCSIDGGVTCSSSGDAVDGGDGPEILEVCDGEDQDCDGAIDEDVLPSLDPCLEAGVCAGAEDARTCVAGEWSACTYPQGVYLPDGEVCDSLDNDCDGDIDEEFSFEGSSVGDACDGSDADECAQGTVHCFSPTEAFCEEKFSAIEKCTPDGGVPVDDDCDGEVDEAGAAGCANYFYDGDLDGYSLLATDGMGEGALQPQCLCEPDPVTHYAALVFGDCDDADPLVNPGGEEHCTVPGEPALDEDCDGVTDEAGALGCTWFRRDQDGDGYGVADDQQCLCEPSDLYSVPEGESVDDCDDTNPLIHPGHVEVCDPIDHNCDGQTASEDAEGCTMYFPDHDSDGYGDSDDGRCLCTPLGAHISVQGGDCCDNSAAAKPGQSAWFASPVPCAGGGYDWNCDGATESQWPEVGVCQCKNPGLGDKCLVCEVEVGWAGVDQSDVPDCGELGFLLEKCGKDKSNDDECSVVKFSESTPQGCR